MDKLTPKHEAYRAFDTPETFNCVVHGKMLKATVTGKYDLPVQYGFQVNFSDGFKAAFVTEDPSGWWCENPEGKEYAFASKQDLTKLLKQTL